MLATYEKNARLKLITTVVMIVVIAGVVVFADHLKAQRAGGSSTLSSTTATSLSAPSSTPAPAATVPATNSSNTSAATNGYKDGTYTASSSYYVPRGQESIQVKLTLSGGNIANVSIQNSEGDNTSALFQEDFASSYKQYVVGKKINSLRLSVIAGASDTTQGFSDALNQIALKAQA